MSAADGSTHFDKIDSLFHPRSIAVVGESSTGKIGPGFLDAHVQQGFAGKLYAINPNGKVRDFETYPSLLEVPGPVDHVIASVRATYLKSIIEDCVEKKVKSIAIFTSGFREWEGDVGAQKESEMVALAQKAGIRIIGPNCMGFYCPNSGMSYRADMPTIKGGHISIISQSGGVAMTPVYAAAEKGIGFAKSISYGNECDFGAVDSLLYLSEDPDTKIICMYIEGTQDGKGLKEALTIAARAKPVLMIKGGRTEFGSRAAVSHTGAMSGSNKVWEALCRQTGAIMVNDIPEMLDTAWILMLSPKPTGRRLGMVSISGGLGVMFTDLFTLKGFEIPSFSEKLKKDLKQWVDVPGTSIQNPLDMATSFFSAETHLPLFERLGKEEDLDIITVVLAMEYMGKAGVQNGQVTNFLLQFLTAAFKAVKKTLVIVFPETTNAKDRLDMEKYLIKNGYPVFPSVQRCARALNNVLQVSQKMRIHNK